MAEIPFFDTIVEIANERVVTAADFVPFVGRENWLTIDNEYVPAEARDPHEKLLAMSGILVGYVYGFTLIDANTTENMCGINIDGLGVVWMDADELAIRMEDS